MAGFNDNCSVCGAGTNDRVSVCHQPARSTSSYSYVGFPLCPVCAKAFVKAAGLDSDRSVADLVCSMMIRTIGDNVPKVPEDHHDAAEN